VFGVFANRRKSVYSLLLVIIYLAFISLGLPDSLLGAGWPVMQAELNVPLSYAGIVTMIIAGGTIISSLFSDRLTKKLGAGLVTAISVMLTALALIGFSVSNRFYMLCLWAIPYGLGAGAIDAALNNYVALHYSSRHMSWLHCFWGVGATISPYIMGYFLTGGRLDWPLGYRTVGFIQIGLTVILFASLPIWKRNGIVAGKEKTPPIGLAKTLKVKGVPYVLVAFLAYCGMEQTASIWASSYLVVYHGTDAETAARFASLFFIGMTVGRFLNGFAAGKLSDKQLIRIGMIISLSGVILMGIPVGTNVTALIGLVIVGLGCAPVYPSIIHATPYNFGKEYSQAIVGVEMAFAYIGSTFLPPLFGVIAEKINIGLYPVYLLFFGIIVLIMSEVLNKKVAPKPEALTVD
jgi:fucose permease